MNGQPYEDASFRRQFGTSSQFWGSTDRIRTALRLSTMARLSCAGDERLILGRFRPGDLAFIFQHFAAPDVGPTCLTRCIVTARTQAQAILDFYLSPTPASTIVWVIVARETMAVNRHAAF